MAINSTREQRREMARINNNLPAILVVVPEEKWPLNANTKNLVKVWRSRTHLVQGYDDGMPNQLIRLSVNRTILGKDGRWNDGITWDELQALKGQAGYSDYSAIEIYPTNRSIVNVANMRHLWVLKEHLKMGWNIPNG